MRLKNHFEPFLVMTNGTCILSMSDSLWVYFCHLKSRALLCSAGKIYHGTFTLTVIPCFMKTHSEHQDWISTYLTLITSHPASDMYLAMYNAYIFVQILEGKIRVHIIHG